MAACRRACVGVALFSACVNLLMLTVPMQLTVPMYMMQVYDRVLATSNIDTLLALSAMVAVGLGTFGLLDAVRNRVLARVGVWFERELGSPILGGAIAEARRSGGGVSAQGLRDLATVRGYVAGQGIMPLFGAPWAPAFLAIVFVIHPVLGWIGLLGAVALFACAALNDLAIRKRLTEATSASVRALNDADAAIRNAAAITAMGMLPDLARRWQDTTARSLDQQTAATDTSGGISAAAKALRFGLQASMLGVGRLPGHRQPDVGRQHRGLGGDRRARPVPDGVAHRLVAQLFVGARAAYQRLAELLERAPADEGGTVLRRRRQVGVGRHRAAAARARRHHRADRPARRHHGAGRQGAGSQGRRGGGFGPRDEIRRSLRRANLAPVKPGKVIEAVP